MIERDVKLLAREGSVSLGSDVVIYRGDGQIMLNFEVQDGRYKYRAENLAENINAVKANATLVKANGEPIRSEMHLVLNNVVQILISKDMIDSLDEVGIFQMQIHLYDADDNRLTLAPFSIKIEDDILPH